MKYTMKKLKKIVATSFRGFNAKTKKQIKRQKLKYAKRTYVLAVIGFFGSMGFYFGVLQKVLQQPDDQIIITEQQQRIEQLEDQVHTLTNVIEDCQGYNHH